MKKFSTFLSCALVCAGVFSSCEKQKALPVSPEPEMAELSIRLEGVDADISTKASTTANGTDKTISSAQIFVYNPAGTLVGKLSSGGRLSVPKGFVYTVQAVANGPVIANPTITSVEATAVNLQDYPFIMYKKTTVSLVNAATAACTLKVESLASRVRVASIKNEIPGWTGSFTLQSVFLCNVVGTAKIGGAPQPISLNWYGRKVLTTPVSAGGGGAVDETVPAGTYTVKSLGSPLASGASYTSNIWLYCFPNANKTPIPAAGITSTAADQTVATWLTIRAIINDKNYFWTVNLGEKITATTGLKANYTYDVSVTLRNIGSENPSIPVVPGSLDISVIAEPWKNGGDITQVI